MPRIDTGVTEKESKVSLEDEYQWDDQPFLIVQSSLKIKRFQESQNDRTLQWILYIDPCLLPFRKARFSKLCPFRKLESSLFKPYEVNRGEREKISLRYYDTNHFKNTDVDGRW